MKTTKLAPRKFQISDTAKTGATTSVEVIEKITKDGGEDERKRGGKS